jgi:hypothetical protein
LPRRRRRQLIDGGEQLIEEEDCANPKEKVATRQTKSVARFDGLRRGACGKRAQLVCLSDLCKASGGVARRNKKVYRRRPV